MSTRASAPPLARLVTEVLAPWVLVLSLPLVVAWHATGNVPDALLWGAVVGLTGSVIPMVVIVHGARRGRWNGHHVTNREGRLVPLLACLASLGLGIAALTLGGAPRAMVALALAMFLSLVVCLAVTFGVPVNGERGWKVSFHAAVAAGAVTVLFISFGPWALLGVPLVALVAWSRVALGDHTTPQVVVGALLGAVLAGSSFWLLA
ncbi:phosphatase PAP2 family protein [Saccharothrix syringae]|uniref:Phosphatase PAP2 family protein n=1 Tax=Saccharothrix syringae TaxID=103733 RepID=A0A5Q0GXG4_SACSY|nr:phosphatase PAP2 family protein [Saccharothrix syringae]QFZ18032.1 phosphatase PAP2 family protein [Saccharothrix syringae]